MSDQGPILTSLKGRLLVAAPPLEDPNFDRTVVFLIEHTAEGALGVVLNRPTALEVSEPFPAWAPLASPPSVVFVGGPVQTGTSALALGNAAVAEESPSWAPVAGGVGMVDLDGDPDDAWPRLDQVRVFSGYAGWDGGQLEAELEAGAWFVVAAQPADVFSTDPEELWRTVLRRQGGRLAILANHPPELRLN